MKKYVIFDIDKKSYVSKDGNRYVLHSDLEKAHMLESKNAAKSLCKMGLSKKIADGNLEIQMLNVEICDDEHKNDTSVGVKNLDIDSSKYVVSVINDTLNKFNNRLFELQDELSKYERQVCDIQHYIELNAGKFNAYDGYKAYKMLQDVLIERRKVKDELLIIQTTMDSVLSSDQIDMIGYKVNELKTRTYKPRELTYLFEAKEK